MSSARKESFRPSFAAHLIPDSAIVNPVTLQSRLAAALEARVAQRQPSGAPLAAEVDVIVAGTEYYQAFERLGKGPVMGASIEREPSNKHDPNAVCVKVYGEVVGYLSRSRALKYAPVLTAEHSVEAYRATAGAGHLFVRLPRM